MPEDVERHGDEEESIRALRSGSSNEKCDALERLSECESAEVRDAILELLYDEEQLVRVECVETVAGWNDLEYVPRLMERIYDISKLVRRCAIIGLADMGARDVLPIAEGALLDCRTSESDRQAFHYAQCRLEGDSHIFPFLCHLFSEDYTIRTSTARFLDLLVNDRNSGFLLHLLELLRSREEPPAVREALEETRKEILLRFG